MLLTRLLDRLIRTGRLTVIDAAGRTRSFGPGGVPAVTVRLHSRLLPYRLLLSPALSLGEAYMDGTLTIEEGTLRDFLHLATQNYAALDGQPFRVACRRLARPFRLLPQYNPIRRARRNVAHHYDLSGSLYEMFLDGDRQYSCAYFEDGMEGLDEAQDKKRRHIVAKLMPEPGMRVLDIGSGWGGLAFELARTAGVGVTGITLSEEQLAAARSRAASLGLSDQVRFLLRDYREEHGVYDRVVSVGMLEHVGAAHYQAYFDSVRRLLKPDGIALVHAIGRMEPPGGTDRWLRKYIFPGGYCPALSEVLAAVEKTGLWVTDIEVLRIHYAETLRHWFERFQAKREAVSELYDERFCRMWEFYLAACEMAFRNGPMMVFQIQLARRRDTVPLTRDYITEVESRSAAAKVCAA